MRTSKHNDLEINLLPTPLASFMESYNKSAPRNFPRASVDSLKQFQETHPALFKNGQWSIDKHRKKFMDWFASNQSKA